MPGRNSTCAWSFHTLRRLARQEAVLDDLAEQVDRVGVLGLDGHVATGLPVVRRGDGHLELALVETVGRGVDLRLDDGLALARREIAGDGGLARARADRVGHGEIVVESDPELDD